MRRVHTGAYGEGREEKIEAGFHREFLSPLLWDLSGSENIPTPPPAHELEGLGLQDSALYLRDAYGRCLRLQLRIRVAGGATEQNGHLDVWETAVRERLVEWRRLLTTRVEDGRQLLREVLSEPLRFIPERKTYRFEGKVGVEGLLAGVVPLHVKSQD